MTELMDDLAIFEPDQITTIKNYGDKEWNAVEREAAKRKAERQLKIDACNAFIKSLTPAQKKLFKTIDSRDDTRICNAIRKGCKLTW